MASCNPVDTGDVNVSTQVAKKYNLAYGSEGSQKLDVFLPANRTATTPFLLLIHGGGWNSGDKNSFYALQDSLLGRGIASATMNYRLAIGGNIHGPEMMADVRDALQYCLSNRVAWGISPTAKPVIGGYSAGAHLSLLYAHKHDSAGQIGGVVDAAGPTSLADTSQLQFAIRHNLLYLITTYVGAPYTPGQPLDPRFAENSPLLYVRNVPTLMIHGPADSTVPYSAAVNLEARMAQFGYTRKLVTIPNGDHNLSMHIPANNQTVVSEIAQWVLLYSR